MSKIVSKHQLEMDKETRTIPFINIPHKLHILGHFLAISSRFVMHIAIVRVLPHSLSKLSQFPETKGVNSTT